MLIYKGRRLRQRSITDIPGREARGAFDTSNTLVISDSLDKEYSVKAEFELAYYKLDLWMSYGSITARYLSSSGTAGESFSSGSKVNPIQKIQLTAVPDSGKSIKEWRIYNNSTVDPYKYEIVKADDGVSNYTAIRILYRTYRQIRK